MSILSETSSVYSIIVLVIAGLFVYFVCTFPNVYAELSKSRNLEERDVDRSFCLTRVSSRDVQIAVNSVGRR